MTVNDQIKGCLIGAAVGDSMGLPMEGLSAARIARRFRRPFQQCLLGRWGMCSDDTEHAFFVSQSILAHRDDPDAFARALAWRLRWWFLGLPAGVGLATARSCLKLWTGRGPEHSGVFSAGNGPAMRAPIIGAVFARDPERRQAFLERSTVLTHTDPKAMVGARAIADLTAGLVQDVDRDDEELLRILRDAGADDPEWGELMDRVREGLLAADELEAFLGRLGLEWGISGYVYHTVPAVVFAVLRHRQDPAAAISALVGCGGDTDTTAAIAGGVLGAAIGAEAFPKDWRDRIHNGPLSLEVLGQAASQLALSTGSPVKWCWQLVPLRNLVFLCIVLAHGFRRLLPC